MCLIIPLENDRVVEFRVRVRFKFRVRVRVNGSSLMVVVGV